jgi:hypothetical protein
MDDNRFLSALPLCHIATFANCHFLHPAFVKSTNANFGNGKSGKVAKGISTR